MPNHVDGILFLDPSGSSSAENREEQTADQVETGPSYALGFVRVKRALSLDKSKNEKSGSIPGSQRIQNIGKNTLSSIVGAYKSAVTKHANRMGLEHGWQPKFFDWIIRSDRELQQTATYIETNPATWEEDEFYGDE